MHNWEELLYYRNWFPITEDNRDFVYDGESIGMMKTKVIPRKENPIEFARLTDLGYSINKRDQLLKEKGFLPGIKRFLYSVINSTM